MKERRFFRGSPWFRGPNFARMSNTGNDDKVFNGDRHGFRVVYDNEEQLCRGGRFSLRTSGARGLNSHESPGTRDKDLGFRLAREGA